MQCILVHTRGAIYQLHYYCSAAPKKCVSRCERATGGGNETIASREEFSRTREINIRAHCPPRHVWRPGTRGAVGVVEKVNVPKASAQHLAPREGPTNRVKEKITTRGNRT